MNTLTYPVIGIAAALLIGNPAVASAQEPAKLREVQTFLLNGLATSIAISPDGKQILISDYFPYASAFENGDVRAWDAGTGKLLFKLDDCKSQVSQLILSRDGKRLVTGSLDKSVKMWDAETGKLLRSFVGHDAEVVSVAISPDGKHVVSSSGHRLGLTVHKRREVHVWDATTGKLLRSLEIEKTVNRVAISPDGKRIAGSSGGNFADGTIILWDLETGKKLHTLTGPEGKASVWGARYSGDGKRIIGASETDHSKDAVDASLIEWDAETGKHLRTLPGPKGWLPPFEISPDGKRIASGARDGSLLLWDAETARVIAVGKQPKSDRVRSIAFSPDGDRLVEGNGSYHATVWALLNEPAPAGYLGIAVTVEQDRPTVDSVAENSPAAKAGVKPGDVITKLDGKDVGTVAEFTSEVQKRKAGDEVTLTLTRGTDTVEVKAKLIARPMPKK